LAKIWTSHQLNHSQAVSRAVWFSRKRYFGEYWEKIRFHKAQDVRFQLKIWKSHASWVGNGLSPPVWVLLHHEDTHHKHPWTHCFLNQCCHTHEISRIFNQILKQNHRVDEQEVWRPHQEGEKE
jgi:predicted 3-demethylubiquinone-9 3-methyltransferase (glyoxalase superfamily)